MSIKSKIRVGRCGLDDKVTSAARRRLVGVPEPGLRPIHRGQ